MIRAWLVDDESLAVKRLSRMLTETGRVEVVGTSTDPEHALTELAECSSLDVLFLDIEMPGMNGFELLSKLESKLESRPLVVFTTAYDQYAVRAFEANGIDYLLKPVSPESLDRAITRIERAKPADTQDYKAMFERLAAALQSGRSYPRRLPSKLGDRVQFIDLDKVTHFFAEGKLTYAAAAGKNFVVDDSIVQLETKLDPAQFHRIHRAYMVNLSAVQEVCSWFGGKMIVRMRSQEPIELPIARDRLKSLKERLGF